MFCITSLLLMAVVAGPVPPAETIEMTLADASYGTEELRRTEGPEGAVLVGMVSLKVPGMGDAVFSQELKLARDGLPVSYSVEIDAPGQQFILRTLPTATEYTVSVTPKGADFELLRARTGTSGGRVTYRSFAGLNHLFMKVERESTGAEYGIPGEVDPVVISAIADWILLR